MRNSSIITKLFKKMKYYHKLGYLTKVKLWSNNNLSYPKGIAEDEAVFFPLLALSER